MFESEFAKGMEAKLQFCNQLETVSISDWNVFHNSAMFLGSKEASLYRVVVMPL